MLIELATPRKAHGAGRALLRNGNSVAPQVAQGDAVDFSGILTRNAGPARAPDVVPPEVLDPVATLADDDEPEAAAAPVPAPLEGGFLAELEQEVRSQQAPEVPDLEVIERNTRMANAACRTVTDYWTRLAEQLNTLKPATPSRYVFDGRTVLERLPSHGFRVVPKLRVAHSGDEHFESVTLAWRVGKGERIKLLKDFPTEIERLKARLSFAGINAFESQARDPDSGRSRGLQFEFTADVSASVRITPLHAEGKVRLTLLNLGALERVEADFPAFAMRVGELDDLARMICGRPNSLLKHAQNIDRREP
jgi:hypothetical protein